MSDLRPGRRLWLALEPLHATTYFAPETAEAYRAVGLRGFWMGYMGARAAALGPVPPAVVTATLFGFHPAMVERAIPDAWSFAEPAAILEARERAMAQALTRLCSDASECTPAPAVEALGAVVDRLDHGGRPLAAAHAALPRPADPLVHLWLLATVWREHRGDGHVATLVAEGLDGCEANVLAVACGQTPRADLQPHRGWCDDDWAAAEERLRARGWVGADGEVTAAGRAAKARIEDRTDRLSEGGLRSAEEADDIVRLVRPFARAVVAAGGVPFPNPMGLPRSAR